MSLISRFHGQMNKITRIMPAFMPQSRALDFHEKGKAEENVYFRREQDRQLTKLRKFFLMQQQDEAAKNAAKASKGFSEQAKKDK